MLLITHIILITGNMSTVEQMGMSRMRERENRMVCALHAWWQIREKCKMRAQWDSEWGRIGKEGHMWWLGSTRANWEAVMGNRIWMWFRACRLLLPVSLLPMRLG